MERLARYIIRASFSQERMTYLDQEGKVIYQAQDGKSSRSFPALEWLAARCSHIPNRGEQIENPSVIRAILEHMGLWLVRSRPSPKIHDPPVCTQNVDRYSIPYITDDHSQLHPNYDYLYGNPEYSWNQYIQS